MGSEADRLNWGTGFVSVDLGPTRTATVRRRSASGTGTTWRIRHLPRRWSLVDEVSGQKVAIAKRRSWRRRYALTAQGVELPLAVDARSLTTRHRWERHHVLCGRVGEVDTSCTITLEHTTLTETVEFGVARVRSQVTGNVDGAVNMPEPLLILAIRIVAARWMRIPPRTGQWVTRRFEPQTHTPFGAT
jgi:hypothetical protein